MQLGTVSDTVGRLLLPWMPAARAPAVDSSSNPSLRAAPQPPTNERGARGQALVETALVLPILLLILTGIMQFGILLSGQVALVNGVREAARFGSVLQTASAGAATADAAQVTTRLRSVLQGGMPAYQAARLTASTVCYVSYQNPGSSPPTYSVRITVSATYNHALFVPIIAQILDPIDGSFNGGFTLHASERFRVENVPLPTNVLPTPIGSAGC
jgi:Flp pilus assembly protein TadG